MIDIKAITYNIHKGKSFLLRSNVLKEINILLHKKKYDFIFLQEVRDYNKKDFELHRLSQTQILSNGHYKSFYGKNKVYKDSHHGNAILTNHEVISHKNFDISVSKLESRGFFVLKVKIKNNIINVACTHLNLKKKDRIKQINLINKIIEENFKNEPIIIAGDFNDFDGGVEKLLNELNFRNLVSDKSFPHIYPIFNIDKVFIKDINILSSSSSIKKCNKTLLMSDHLPIELDMSFNLNH